jgi:hypothetical protein
VSLQLAMRSALPVLPVDRTTDYMLCSTCRYYDRLSALFCSVLVIGLVGVLSSNLD